MVQTYYSDLGEAVNLDNQGNITLAINDEAIKSSITNILLTTKGERVMRPTFGSTLRELLFSPMVEAVVNQLMKQMQVEINEWDDRVIVNRIDYEASPDKNKIQLDFSFSVRGYTDIFTHTVDIEG